MWEKTFFTLILVHQELEDRNLLFMGQEKQISYLEKMFARMV